jgi:HEPN domain-containing protein
VDLAAAFLSAAEEDLRAAEACLAAGRAPATAFFAQQAGEKAAKAWLLSRGYRPGRTHYATPVLVRVLGREGACAASLRGAVDDLHDLEEYATGARYPARGAAPGSYEPPGDRIDAREAAAALRQAKAVVATFAAAARTNGLGPHAGRGRQEPDPARRA